GKVGVTLGGRIAQVPENFSRQVEADAGSNGNRREAVAQIVDAGVGKRGLRADPFPALVDVDEVGTFAFAGDNEGIALDAGQGREDLDCGRIEPDGLSAGL